jgi:caspase domain-containing protein
MRVAFGADGAIFAVDTDGRLRRYDADLNRTASSKVDEGVPVSISVRPQGDRIAIAYHDADGAKAPDIFDARSLRRIGSPDTSGIDRGGLTELSWTRDGERLFAGGRYIARIAGTYRRMVRMFDIDGRRVGVDIPVAANTIKALTPCGDSIAFGAGDPTFGLLSRNGGMTLSVSNHIVDMRGKLAGAFTVSVDGKKLRFGLGIGGDEPALFDLTAGTLTTALSPIADFVEPDTTGIDITNWKDSFQQSLDGKPFVNLHEINQLSFSLAVRSDRTGFVLGMQNYLVAFDGQGKERWERPVGAGYGVNITSNGNLVIAALSDGTIRWYRWSDGRELLALFVNSATKAWIVWTPSGYYTASPGGEDLIGWQLNRGCSQAADFFPASRFRERFNRPDIVNLALDTLDEDAAIKQANQNSRRRHETRPLIEHLPPVARIESPAEGAHVQSGTVTLKYALRSPSGLPVERVDILIDGRPVKAIGLPVNAVAADTEVTGSVEVALAQHLSAVGLIAWSGALASQAAQVKITWDGAPEATRKLYAVVVGVSDYSDPALRLQYAAKDARDFAAALQAQKGLYYADVQIHPLVDREVTRASVIEALQWLEKSAPGPNDVSVLFLAGHGFTDEKQTYLFYPSDATDGDQRAKGVSETDIRKTLQDLQGKILWFLDTCSAGSATKRPPVDMNVLINGASASENGGIVVFASSTGRQVSVESGDWGNGAFTKAIIEGIKLGKADLLGDGNITTSSLDTFLEHRVRMLTEEKQTPVMARPPGEPDFTIALVNRR